MGEKKVFIRNIVLVIVCFVLMSFLIGIGFKAFHEYNYKQNPSGFFTEYKMKDVNGENIIIGSSAAFHGYKTSIFKDSLGVDIVNYGIDGSFFLHQVCIINSILDRYTPKLIIWNLEPYCLTNSTLPLEINTFYTLYPMSDQPMVKEILDKYSPSTRYELLLDPFRYNSLLPNELKIYFRRDKVNYTDYRPFKTTGYDFPIRRKVNNDDLKYMPSNKDYLQKVVTRCKKDGAFLIICIAPRFVDDSEYIKTKQYKAILDVTRKNNVPFFNYFQKKEFMNDSTLFHDRMHMNDNGAELYTRMLVGDIRNLILINQ